MDGHEGECGYEIVSYRWDRISEAGKAAISGLLRTDAAGAAAFCKIYFDKFDIVHKIGHVLAETFNPPGRPAGGASREHEANRFAVAYFRHKKEDKYLETLDGWMNALLSVYRAHFDFVTERLDPLYDKYRMDLRTLGALHFTSIRKALLERESLEAVVGRQSGGALRELNRSIVFRPGLSGQHLLSECVSAVFELGDFVPDIRLRYGAAVTIGELEVTERARATEKAPA